MAFSAANLDDYRERKKREREKKLAEDANRILQASFADAILDSGNQPKPSKSE